MSNREYKSIYVLMPNTEASRLKQFRKACQLSQIDMAKKLGLKQGSYSNLESGRRTITYSCLKILVKNLGLNPYWYITGKGTAWVKNTEDRVSNIIKSVDVKAHQQIVSKLVDEKKELERYIDSLEQNVEMSKRLISLYESNSITSDAKKNDSK